MTLPFSHDDFLTVFAAYNAALWPMVLLLWLATAWLAVRALRASVLSRATLFTLLAVHWAWSGVAYHWIFFRPINPAATMFGAAFVVEAGLLTWLALSRAPLVARHGTARVVGVSLLIYGLVYPFLGVLLGLRYPYLPLFAVPCPTTLVTAGLFLMYSDVPKVVKIVPASWAFLATSAAFALGIWGDLALLLAGFALTIDLLTFPSSAPLISSPQRQ